MGVMEPSVDVVEASNEFIELVLDSEGFDETTGEEVQRSEEVIPICVNRFINVVAVNWTDRVVDEVSDSETSAEVLFMTPELFEIINILINVFPV